MQRAALSLDHVLASKQPAFQLLRVLADLTELLVTDELVARYGALVARYGPLVARYVQLVIKQLFAWARFSPSAGGGESGSTQRCPRQ